MQQILIEKAKEKGFNKDIESYYLWLCSLNEYLRKEYKCYIVVTRSFKEVNENMLLIYYYKPYSLDYGKLYQYDSGYFFEFDEALEAGLLFLLK